MSREIKADRGTEISCRGWRQEAILQCRAKLEELRKGNEHPDWKVTINDKKEQIVISQMNLGPL